MIDDRVSELPGVLRVIPNSLHQLQTTRSWDYLGLSFQSPKNILHSSNMGDGVIIGVLDTGLTSLLHSYTDAHAYGLSEQFTQ